LTKVVKTETEWRAQLDPAQYRILREKGTEAPFSGEYDHVFEPGTYHCAGCGAVLFASDAKYDSGWGGPAFYEPAATEAVEEETDRSYGQGGGPCRASASFRRDPRPVPQLVAASCPHAAAMSRPRVRRTVAGSRARSRTCLKAAIASRDDPSYIPVGL
jgi:methionine-R-sulfoxide reductase